MPAALQLGPVVAVAWAAVPCLLVLQARLAAQLFGVRRLGAPPLGVHLRPGLQVAVPLRALVGLLAETPAQQQLLLAVLQLGFADHLAELLEGRQLRAPQFALVRLRVVMGSSLGSPLTPTTPSQTLSGQLLWSRSILSLQFSRSVLAAPPSAAFQGLFSPSTIVAWPSVSLGQRLPSSWLLAPMMVLATHRAPWSSDSATRSFFSKVSMLWTSSTTLSFHVPPCPPSSAVKRARLSFFAASPPSSWGRVALGMTLLLVGRPCGPRTRPPWLLPALLGAAVALLTQMHRNTTFLSSWLRRVVCLRLLSLSTRPALASPPEPLTLPTVSAVSTPPPPPPPPPSPPFPAPMTVTLSPRFLTFMWRMRLESFTPSRRAALWASARTTFEFGT